MYSLAERDRRWEAVRRGAADHGLDCVFVPLGDGLDGRYLTQLPVAGVVLPTDGGEPIVLTDPLRDRSAYDSWVPEPSFVRRGQWASAMETALLDAGMERARIGVAGLKGGTFAHLSAPDGVVSHTPYAEVVRRLSGARFEDATDVVGFARYVKGDEEIANLRGAAAIAEDGAERLRELAVPGADLAAIYAAVMGGMLARGSEYVPLTLTVASRSSGSIERYEYPPSGHVLRDGDLVTGRVTATCGGHQAIVVEAIPVGVAPAELVVGVSSLKRLLRIATGIIRPGARLVDVVSRIAGHRDAPADLSVSLQGLGLGDDGPMARRESGRHVAPDVQIVNRTAWALTLAVALPSSPGAVTVGESILVTGLGAQRLAEGVAL